MLCPKQIYELAGFSFCGMLIASKPRMMRIFIHIALFLALICPCSLLAETRAPLLPSDGELQMIELINEARRQPLAVAESFGKASVQVLDDFPELSDILRNGLLPVSTHQALLGSSLEHAQDMLENSYYSKSSQNGNGPIDRMEAFGYIASDGDVLLGMLAFRNYMEEEKAVQLIFKSMFLDELDPEWTGRKCILDPNFTDIGVSVKIGQWVVNGETLNIYMVVCDFGATAVNDAEATLMILINQARRFPIQQMKALGITLSEALDAIPYISDYASEGMTPVGIDKNLYWTANAHGWEMLDMDYLSSISLDGLTPKQRILESGYPALTAGELIRPISTTNPVDVLLAAGINFERLLRREFDPANTRKILNPVFTDAGPGVLASTPEARPEDEDAGLFDKYHVNLLVCDLASKATDDQSGGVYGWAYCDINLNGLYDPGEGMARASVKIRDNDSNLLADLFTDNAGGFWMKLSSGEYLITVDDGVGKSGRRVSVVDGFVSVPVRFVPENDELQN